MPGVVVLEVENVRPAEREQIGNPQRGRDAEQEQRAIPRRQRPGEREQYSVYLRTAADGFDVAHDGDSFRLLRFQNVVEGRLTAFFFYPLIEPFKRGADFGRESSCFCLSLFGSR